MRILFVTHAFPREEGDVAGGFILRLARALVDQGAELLVLAPSAAGLRPVAEIEGITVRRFRYAPRAWETLAYSGTMAEQVAASLRAKLSLAGMIGGGILAARRAATHFGPDVVHAHWWFPAGLIATTALSHRPVVSTLHGSDVRLARGGLAATALFRRVMARSAAVTTVSTWLAAEAHAMAPGFTLAVAPMPAAVDRFAPGTIAGVSQPARLLFVGRLNAQKGLSLLLDALALTRSGAILDVVGDGEYRERLEARANALGIGSRVAWLGALPQERLVPLYQQAAALIVPGENEGLGLVAVEAQLCATPVIAAGSGGLRDVVTQDVTGVLTAPGDAAAMAAAIDDLLARPDRGRSLGRAGRTTSLARFSPHNVAKTYRAIYERAIATANRRRERLS
ncbi:MAG: glycosyltransferase [Gemmatimonadaceae bacterium]